MKKYSLLFSLFLSCLIIQAQDLHFSQPQFTPLTVNPALAGTGCGGRLIATYRNQWASVLKENAFNTASLAYDVPIALKNGDKIGIGSNFLFDKAGQLDFQTLGLNLIGVYHKKIKKTKGQEQFLGFGFSSGIFRRSINFEQAQWASQHDGNGGFNGNLSSGESFENDTFYFLDLGVGINWSANFQNGAMVNLGTVFAHLNRANQSFNPTTDLPLYTKFSIHGNAKLPIAARLALTPRIFSLFQGPSFELNSGVGLQYLVNKNTQNAIEIGVATRLANRATPFSNNTNPQKTSLWVDALIFNLTYAHSKFMIGVSYDYNVSDLQQASNGNGAYEITFAYLFCQ